MYRNKYRNIFHKQQVAYKIILKPLLAYKFNIEIRELAVQPTASKLHTHQSLNLSLMYNIWCINEYLDGSTSRVLAAKM